MLLPLIGNTNRTSRARHSSRVLVRKMAAAAPTADWSKVSSDTQQKLKDGFKGYGKFGDRNFTGNNMALKNVDKWLKEAKVLGKDITTTDTSIAFKQVVGNNVKTITFESFRVLLFKLALRADKEHANAKLADIASKLAMKTEPSTTNATAAIKTGAVDRLTDVSKYTGSHKERFDADTGKGKGKEGRVDVDSTGGYVQGYKHKGTFDASK